MVKIDLITGFLGSGKTTFLLKYARYLMKQGLRIGILEYDYGAINVDMLLLGKLRGKQCELEMVAAGCDADCLMRRFKTKLIAMAMSGYDRVIVEPSGVFDMDLFFDTLRDEPLENWYEIGSVITIVNGNLRADLSDEENFLLASQAASAGSIVLSRTQLCTPQEVTDTKAHVLKAAEDIKIKNFAGNFVEKDWEEFEDADLFKIMNSGFHINDYRKITAGKESQFESVCFLNLPDGLEAMKAKVETLFSDKSYGNIHRVKGFVNDGRVNYQINATPYELLINEIATGQKTLIVIGTDLKKEAIEELISEKAI